ncbi:hypothetical protein K523DRAFT_240130 [Schizophyllum commune Tattone D]|nr:hypothetical protein K523DRAFT_240130 [Schizophyllum commune Tattone D]
MGKGVKSEPVEPEMPEEEEEDGDYEIETIMHARVTDEGKGWWAGYSDEENSYVTEEDMSGAQLLIDSFWADVGSDNHDYKPGQILEPSKKWLKRQIKISRGEMEEKRRKKAADKAATHKRAGSSSKKTKDSVIDYDDTGTRKRKSSTVKKEKPIKTERRRRSASRRESESSDDEDNTPLSARPKKKGAQETKERRSTSVSRGKKRMVIDSDDEVEEVSSASPPPRKTKKTYQKSEEEKKKRKRAQTSSSESEDDVPLSHHSPPKKQKTEAKKVVEALFSDVETEVREVAASQPSTSKPRPPPISIPSNSGSQAMSASTSAATPSGISPATDTTKRSYERRGVQMMRDEYTSTSGLSTKAKLAQAKPAQGASLPSFTKKSKQQKEAGSASTPVGAGPSSAGPSTGGVSQAAAGTSTAGPSKPTPLPKRKVPLPHRKGSGSISAPPTPQLDMEIDQRPESAPAPPAPRHTEAAAQFLNQLVQERNFSGLMDFDEPEAAPMEVDHEPVPPPRLKQAPPPLPPAELDSFECTKPVDLVLGASDEPQHVCDMHFFNLTVRRNDTAVPFKVGLGPLDRVVLGRFHDYTDLPLLLQACKPASQIAMVEAATVADRSGFAMVREYLNSMDQVAIIRFFVFEEWIGNIILFPSSAVRVRELFECPAYYQRDDILFAALVPWRIVPVSAKADEHVSMYQFNEATPSLRSQPVPPVQMSSDMKTDLSSRWTVMKGRYQEALHVLQFPKEVLEFVSKQERTFYIHRPSDEFCPFDLQGRELKGRAAEEVIGYETRLLQTVLRRGPIEGERKPPAPSPLERTVWIHVGALHDIGSIPKLVERLGTHDINFYSYGTHESVPRQMWGIHTLFTYGGAVTFTPRSLLNDPFWTASLMSQLHEHPAWSCYIPPYVLGMAVQTFAFSRILEAIDEGRCGFTTAPPSYRSSDAPLDAPIGQPHPSKALQTLRDKWHDEQLDVLALLDGQDILEYALKAYDDRVEKSDRELDNFILDELQDDFAAIQVQPPILYEYRRFIVVHGPRELALRRDRFECMTVDGLVFKDGFFDISLEGASIKS